MPSDPSSIEIALTPRFQKDLRDLVRNLRKNPSHCRILAFFQSYYFLSAKPIDFKCWGIDRWRPDRTSKVND
jgi:hypothetical protein